jgi:uncharacterized membrane protein YebE (DUF533 family)
MDAKRLLDTLLGALAQIGQPAQPSPGQAPTMGQSGPAAQDGQRAPGSLGLPPKVTDTVQQVTGQTPDQLLHKARTVVEQHPGLAQAAAIGVAGLLFGTRRKGRSFPGTLARLGGLAVIGGLAYKAYQNSQAGKTLLEGTPASAGGQAGSPDRLPGTSAASQQTSSGSMPHGTSAMPAAGATPGIAGASASLDVPQGSGFHPVSQTEDDALLYLRAMVAAAACDGHIAEAERSQIVRGLTEAGIDPRGTGWLDRELQSPADVEELAAGVTSPEKAAQVYAAARIAIDPDTIQEREFLRRLGEALDLNQAVQAQIDSTAAALKVGTP